MEIMSKTTNSNSKIKIKSSDDTLYWYYDRIGEVFDIVRIEKIDGIIYYWVKTADRYNTLNFVLESDAELIEI